MMLSVAGCGQQEPGEQSPTVEATTVAAAITAQRILAADASPGEWLTHGRTYDEQRFSPLDQINAQNVAGLGLAWYVDLDYNRGIEATPLIADGVMYTTGSWSVVYAMNAATGELRWKYDPQVPREKTQHLCCDAVNRGVALWGDKVYVGTLDGYLVALNRDTGDVAWRVATIKPGEPYAITGAPRVVKGKVLIGNGGSEFGVRGYVTAYDAQTGEQAWRFYTVPGNPAEAFESPAMEMAAATWQGGDWWTAGGGGTVWDSMAYDPALDLLYIGVGNGAPYSRKVRSPDGGDNLFLSSIVALRPDTGEYVWHYQTTPGDAWDFTATQHMILADLQIDGTTRKVLMQAPKNGFFYVLDRVTGELLSAENFVEINWAEGIDKTTGRPILATDAFYEEGPRFTIPGPGRRAQLATDDFQPGHGPRVHPGATVAPRVWLRPRISVHARLLEHRSGMGLFGCAGRPGTNCAHRRHGERPAAGLGPGDAEGRVDGRPAAALGRRPAEHGRQFVVPGHADG